MRRILSLALLTSSLILVACGVEAGDASPPGAATTAATSTTTSAPSDPDEPDDPSTTRPVPGDPNEADEALAAAVDATMDLDALALETTAHLDIMGQEVDLSGTGAMDFAVRQGELEVGATSPTADLNVVLRADGDTMWLQPESDQIELPEGKTWVGTTADWLDDGNAFGSRSLLGVLLALKASAGAEVGETKQIDGVEATEHTTVVNYDDVLAALGPEADEFQRALSLSAPEPPDLEITAWVGDDGIIRDFHLEIVDDSLMALGGTYDVAVRDPGGAVPAPEAPPADQVLTGPEAERIVQQLLNG